MIMYIVYLAILAGLYKFSLWFLDPYLRYRNRKKTKEYVLFEKGQRIDAKNMIPYLLDDKKYDVDLSFVVPAYNEEKRLPVMMKDTMPYLLQKVKEGKLFKKIELIIVNDGSKDGTEAMIKKYTEDSTDQINIRGVSLIQNQGKGAAVKYGCLFARGEYIIFADADGATDIKSLDSVFDACKKNAKNGLSCSIGSRYEEGSDADRTAIRRFLSWGMNTLVQFILKNEIKDTQCGFKMFTRPAAKLIFPTQHLERWAFDIEVLFLCGAKRIPIVEIPVKWEEIDGSKLNIFDATLQMTRDMFLIKLLYSLRAWSYQDVYY
jgi:dolichyl-phosphate beta-glucosyltransferase